MFFLLFFINCTAQKLHDLKEITYEASTRGKNLEFKITSDSIIYHENNTVKKIKTPSGTWKEIIRLATKFDVEKIENFNPPSNNRILDKALHATLKFKVNNTLYISQVFDHGNPPVELKEFLDLLFRKVEIK